jgi:hypothetical protein
MLDIMGCWSCLDVGYKIGHSSMFFAILNDEYKVAFRNEEWQEAAMHEKSMKNLEHFGGVIGTAIFKYSPGYDMLRYSFGSDSFHVVDHGYVEHQVKRLFVLDKPFMEIVVQLSKGIKPMKVIRAHPVDLSSTSLFKGIDWRYYLLYYLPILILIASKRKTIFADKNRSDMLVTILSKLASILEQLSRTESTLTVEQIWKFQEDAIFIVKNVPYVYQDYSMVTPKCHSLLHLISEVLRWGMFPNHSAQVFEASFSKNKEMSSGSKINLIPSIIDCVGFEASMLRFSFLSNEILEYLKSPLNRFDLFSDKKKGDKRNGNSTFQFCDNNNNLTIIKSFNKYPLTANVEISTDFYCKTKETNDQFVLLKIENEIVLAKIMAIRRCDDENDEGHLDIFYIPSTPINDETNELTCGRIFKVQFTKNVLAIARFIDVVEQVYCHEDKDGDAYYIKIVK